ncbi:hypothetical protein [Clostridium perfringens]|uniref:hypothetical protein n=1 Tax=Clostridium perfringens TaxID=1502 RepID=UPI00290FBEE5|nr:hypothetical protein [Clostridium perfringens]MDM0678269.1 hypothetical protein [Clostridium perfringens]MDU3600283.1 hypothetical protein [Clostridium perfringens]MEA5268693.1 hypothetical protein [Clostridium perfringens]MEA5380384.1 hypothetical protein [Clostridium perfringens]
MSIELKSIADNRTQLKASYKSHNILIEQLKFIGAKPTKESSRYCYFEFEGDISKTRRMLGIGY